MIQIFAIQKKLSRLIWWWYRDR